MVEITPKLRKKKFFLLKVGGEFFFSISFLNASNVSGCSARTLTVSCVPTTPIPSPPPPTTPASSGSSATGPSSFRSVLVNLSSPYQFGVFQGGGAGGGLLFLVYLRYYMIHFSY